MHVFLDLDGTLTDSRPGIIGSFAYALKSLGVTPPLLDDLTWVIGPALIDSFRKFYVDDPDRAPELYREKYTSGGLFENSVYAGIPEALGKMKNDGFELHVATAKPHAYARKITAHFGLDEFFTNEFGPELDGTRNNKGELLAYALDLTGIDAANSVMIGDRIHDIEAAKFVGMRSIGVTWGYGTAEETDQANCLCHSPSDLHATVTRMMAKSAD
jgi:phosphoglycolate phosphatase